MSATTNRDYNLISDLILNTAKPKIDENFNKLDTDVNLALRMDVNPVFESGVTSNKFVYKTASGSYDLALADYAKDKIVGVSNVEDNYVNFYGLAGISTVHTANKPLFLSDVTAGEAVEYQTSKFLGYYFDPNKIYLNPTITDVREQALYGESSATYTFPGGLQNVTNYASSNISTLDKVNGKLIAPSNGSYRIDWRLYIDIISASALFDLSLFLKITGESDKLLNLEYSADEKDPLFFNGTMGFDLDKDDEILMYFKVTEVTGSPEIGIEDSFFSLKRI